MISGTILHYVKKKTSLFTTSSRGDKNNLSLSSFHKEEVGRSCPLYNRRPSSFGFLWICFTFSCFHLCFRGFVWILFIFVRNWQHLFFASQRPCLFTSVRFNMLRYAVCVTFAAVSRL